RTPPRERILAVPTIAKRRSSALLAALLAVEFVDELVFGARNAAWPMLRGDLQLSYEQIGILLSVPTIVAGVIEPAIGVLGDTWRRRALLLGGGIVFAASLALTAASWSWIALLISFAAFNPASGAFVGLSQATLMDLSGDRHEQDMARCVVAGSLGVAAGTGLIALLARAGQSWRTAFVMVAVMSVVAVVVVARASDQLFEPRTPSTTSIPALLRELTSGFRDALHAFRRGEVRRWLALLECANFLM